jgi:protein-disulfide isomerase
VVERKDVFLKISEMLSTGFASVVMMGLFAGAVSAQTAAPVPAAPAAQPGAAAAAPPADPFPAVNMKYFTADTPTGDTVNGFLHSLWGFDPNRMWRVEGIEKTATPGVSKVIVYVTEKTPNARVQSTAFFVMPDGKHAIADTMIDFGSNPYAEKRKLLQERANGPAQGAESKDLLLVEFSDLQCPHCKEAQSTMDQLVHDFPKARIVHQPFPLVGVHPAAFQAAAVGVCVAKQSSDAYFKYEAEVYETQEALTPDGTTKTLDAAVTKAGLDPTAIDQCAATAETKAAVAASIRLAEEAGVDQTPTLSVNGRMLPVSPSAMPYELLKKIVVFQAGLDGVKVDTPPPSLNTLK